jgi:hypothetical protein
LYICVYIYIYIYIYIIELERMTTCPRRTLFLLSRRKRRRDRGLGPWSIITIL